MDTALSTAGTHSVRIDWDLVRFHLVLSVSTTAVGEDAWDVMPSEDLEETFARVASHSSWNAIGWDGIDPDQLVGDLDASTFFCRSHWPCSEVL